MDKTDMILIEVAYATPARQSLLPVEVPVGCTIETAIYRSGILELHPDIDLNTQKVGIFSKTKTLATIVKAGERIEIYRPLTIDPKEARRKRAGK